MHKLRVGDTVLGSLLERRYIGYVSWVSVDQVGLLLQEVDEDDMMVIRSDKKMERETMRLQDIWYSENHASWWFGSSIMWCRPY